VSIITKAFWTVVAVDAIATFLLWKFFAKGSHGLIIAAYLAVLALIAVTILVFPLLRSDGWRTATFVVLLAPSALLLITLAGATTSHFENKARFSGSAFFQGPALELAQAMRNHDTGLAKQLIPAAGNLNQPHQGGTTLWQFGVMQVDDNEESIEMLRALVAAGADPKIDTSANTLQHGMSVGPRLTEFLLEAGANPNLLDHEHRPLWWGAMRPGESDMDTELLRLMLDHGADLRLRAPDGRGPVGQAVASKYWYTACLLIERGADWKQENLRGGPFPVLLEWEIIRRDEYPIPVPEKLRKVLAESKGEPMVIPAARPREAGDIRIPDLLRETGVEKLEETRASVSRLAQQPDWVRRMTAFSDGDPVQRRRVVLLLSLKPEALPEDVQELCWTELREEVAWFDSNAASTPKEPKGWLLKETGIIAIGLASIPGPVRNRHRADFLSVRDRIEACRKANDPSASDLADLTKADWIGR